MFNVIINDCHDDNVRGRQEARIISLNGFPTTFIGVTSDIEAGVNLLEAIDATDGRPGLILVNTAPRGNHVKKWENGTPFGYFWFGETLVIASVDGLVLSAVKKLGFTGDIHLLDIHACADVLLNAGKITERIAKYLPKTQFRSYDFTPRVGAFLLEGGEIPSTPYGLEHVTELPFAVWHIDNFGNIKTTLTREDLHGQTEVETRWGVFPFVEQLRDVPDGEAAITEGSSGFESTRFLELIIQRQSFAKHHEVNIGDDIFSEQRYFTQATE
jgi:hypothetical protein